MAIPGQQRQPQGQAPSPIAPTKAKIDPRFQTARKQATQRAASAQQQSGDALKRRFAAQGGVGSGAFIKQSQLTDQAIREQSGQELQNVDLAEQADVQQRQTALDESAAQRAFASGEAGKQRGFQAEQAGLQRAQQAEQFGQQFGLQKDAFGLQRETQLGNLDIARKELDISEQNAALNRVTAAVDSRDRDFVMSFLESLEQNNGQIPRMEDLNTFHADRMSRAKDQQTTGGGGGAPAFPNPYNHPAFGGDPNDPAEVVARQIGPFDFSNPDRLRQILAPLNPDQQERAKQRFSEMQTATRDINLARDSGS